MIIVAGSLRAKPGTRDVIVEKSAEGVILARATPGCHAFVVAADPVDQDRVVIYERWEDRAALAAFRGSGPDSDIGSEIAAFDVQEFEVTEHLP
jgi:quinol monooxygenase YgiN